MSEVRYKVSFGSARRRPTCNGTPLGKSPTKAEASAYEAQSRPQRPVSRIARQLALAHYVERQVEAGVIKDYAEAARILGMSRGRMAQVMNLRYLPIDVQEGVLTGELNASERSLRRTPTDADQSILTGPRKL